MKDDWYSEQQRIFKIRILASYVRINSMIKEVSPELKQFIDSLLDSGDISNINLASAILDSMPYKKHTASIGLLGAIESPDSKEFKWKINKD